MLVKIWRKKNKNLIHCWWECKLVQGQSKAIWNFLSKVKTDHVIAALFTTAETWKQFNVKMRYTMEYF